MACPGPVRGPGRAARAGQPDDPGPGGGGRRPEDRAGPGARAGLGPARPRSDQAQATRLADRVPPSSPPVTPAPQKLCPAGVTAAPAPGLVTPAPPAPAAPLAA